MNDNSRRKRKKKSPPNRAKVEQAVIDALYRGLTDPDEARDEAAKAAGAVSFIVEITVDAEGKYSATVHEEDAEDPEDKPPFQAMTFLGA